jgi:Helix-turn-helix domain
MREEREAYKLKEAREFLGGISKPSIYRLVERGLLRPNRALRHLVFSREELMRFLRDNTT